MPSDIRNNRAGEFLNPGKFLLILWSRWYWIAASLLLWLAAARIYLQYTPVVYSSSASIRIEDNHNQFSNLSGIPLQKGTANRLQTELILLKSRTILENALDRIDWQVSFFGEISGRQTELYPKKPFKLKILSKEINHFTGEIRFSYISREYYELSFIENESFNKKKCRWNTVQEISGVHFIISSYKGNLPGNKCSFTFNSKTTCFRRIQNGLSITESGKFSSILLLQKKDTNPVFAADALNAVILQYLQNDLHQKTQSALRLSKFIDQQFHTLSSELAVSGKALELFKKDAEINSLEFFEAEITQKLKEANEKINSLTIQMAIIKVAEKTLNEDSEPGIAVSQNLNDPILSEVLLRIGDLNHKKLQSLSTYRSNSIPVKIIQTQVDELTRQAKKLITARKQHVEYLLKLNNKELTKLTNKLQSLPSKKYQFEQVASTYLTNQKILNFLAEKKLETRIGAASILPGASLVDAALPEYTPILPSKKSVWRAALVFGILSGIGLILLKRAANRMFVQNDNSNDRLYSSMYGPF